MRRFHEDAEDVSADELIGLIYEVAETPERWSSLLVKLVVAVQDVAPPETAMTHPLASRSHERLAFSQIGPVSHEWLNETLEPHFQRALRLNRRLVSALRLQERIMSVLEHLPLGVILADGGARVRAMNGRARAILDGDTPLCLQDRHLAALSRSETQKLQDLIRTNAREQEGTGLLTLQGDTALSIMVTPCGRSGSVDIHQEAYCIVFLSTHEVAGYLNEDSLRGLFGLSAAEARIAHALARGLSIDQAAKSLYISPHTARTQLKAVFAKTGTCRQPELVCKVLTSPAVLAARQEGESTPSENRSPAAEARFLTLRDGRRLCFSEYGDPQGTPVLFFHSIVGSRLQIHPDREQVDGFGLRWIVPERPGFGESDPHPGRTLLDWAEDVRELADHLELDRFYLAGFSAGGAHALATAWHLPERVRRMILISPMVPFASAHDLAGMPPTNRSLLLLARHVPGLLAPFMRFVLQGLARRPEQITHRHVELWPAADREMVNAPGVRDYLMRIFVEAVGQGPDGLVEEQLLLARDWGFDLAEVRTETVVWHGERDIHVPPDMLAALRALPRLRMHWVPDRGHFLVLSHWREIFGALAA